MKYDAPPAVLLHYRVRKSRMAQLVEHRVHIAGVTGSSPVATTASPDQERLFHTLMLFDRVRRLIQSFAAKNIRKTLCTIYRYLHKVLSVFESRGVHSEGAFSRCEYVAPPYCQHPRDVNTLAAAM